jgi:hypothetical protein
MLEWDFDDSDDDHFGVRFSAGFAQGTRVSMA